MNKNTKIILAILSVVGVGAAAYFGYQWYLLKSYSETNGTEEEVGTSIKETANKLNVSADDDYEPDDALKNVAGGGVTEESQIAVINNEIFFLNADDGTYISDSGNVYDPETQSLTTTGDNATSTHIEASQVTLTTN
jgi:hypothetical protein